MVGLGTAVCCTVETAVGEGKASVLVGLIDKDMFGVNGVAVGGKCVAIGGAGAPCPQLERNSIPITTQKTLK